MSGCRPEDGSSILPGTAIDTYSKYKNGLVISLSWVQVPSSRARGVAQLVERVNLNVSSTYLGVAQ